MTMGVLIIVLFMVIPLVVGFYAAGKSQNTSDDYFIQGRGMGSVAAFFTVAATWWSAFAFLGSNASFYTEGPVYLTAFAWNILFGFLYFVVGKRVWFLGKKFNYVTPSDLLGDFYNSEKVRILVGLIVIVFTIPYLQIQLTGGAYLIEVASGGVIPFWLAALIFYVVIITYVWVGGIRAVAWTDIIYGALLFFGLLFVGFYIANVVGGPASMFSQMQESHPNHMTLPGPEGSSGYATWISLCFVTAIGAIMGPQIWLRMYSVKNGQLFNLMPFLISLVAITYIGSLFVSWTGVLVMPGVENPDQILPLMLLDYAPFVIGAIVLAGGASAAMSTANSQIHAVSTVMTKDFYQRYRNPEAPQSKLIQVGRYFLLAFSVLAYFLALFAPGLLVTVGLIAFGGTAQLIVPVIGALFWKRGTASGAMAGLIGSLVFIIAFTFIPALVSPLGLDPAMWGLAINTVLFIGVSYATAPRDQHVVDRFDKALREFRGEEGIEDIEASEPKEHIPS
ncbi:sodium:solute symporter family protein [Alteribacillus iranensis]|uniref:Solute:Na+ symporter, SSS family n=1 Tax=Alteribacillus iranensis TaxID=930128 RepID=A0A1I2BTD9_9BACI|nr:sodium:solute symporter family protein [Alteribacillus iranensis]SFE58570.1 solute:Na+ symporter, SSS family [Alteribacillus iranensis]